MEGLIIEQRQGEQADRLFLDVSGELTICFVGEFREALLDGLEKATEITVNVEHVSAVDLTGLQLLCSAHRTASARDKTFGIVGRQNRIFAEAERLAGFSRHVGCVKDVGKTCIWTGGNE
ncbi:sulfate transporter [Geotalea uraniireducens]|uniref:Sulfate transporter n=1 Tax=Geotalea uraniireducens TaxID=351604 RepID=A0ABN6VT76_9BACT|nr:STAS domain-containing protein [Geotalea uraniireducens]BDV42396.1 sulfate transporter [Geotalea uraniireducens]